MALTMIRKLVALLIVIVAVGAGYYFLVYNKKTDANLAGYVPPSMEDGSSPAAGDDAPPVSNGEFWTKRCAEEGEKHCEVFQRLMVKETNQRLIEFAVGYPKDANAVAQAAIIIPLGVVVSEGIGLSVDASTPIKAPIRTCGQDGCIVIATVAEDFIAAMSTGKIMTLSFVDSGTGKTVNVEMSLSGFGDKIKSLAN